MSTEFSDHELAAALASEAGDVLNALRSEVPPGEYDGRALKDAGDLAAHKYLMNRLAELRPDDAVLSEEGKDDLVRLDADRVWIVDPLDGTREFSERGEDGVWRTDWAVHVALWERGQGLTAGAVALPGRAQVLSTATETPREFTVERPLRLAVSRSRPPAILAQLAERIPITYVPMGSAGVKTMAVVEGVVDAYVHGGGQYEWDSAAPVAVARAAGLFTSRLDGSELVYNQENTWLPDLIVCPPQISEELVSAIATILDAEGPTS
jgi:3'(2'), 5'-bisphosphate nucleotidase